MPTPNSDFAYIEVHTKLDLHIIPYTSMGLIYLQIPNITTERCLVVEMSSNISEKREFAAVLAHIQVASRVYSNAIELLSLFWVQKRRFKLIEFGLVQRSGSLDRERMTMSPLAKLPFPTLLQGKRLGRYNC